MIKETDKILAAALQEKIDNLNKPKGSLGRLETLALQIGLIQHNLCPELHHPCHILFGGDHGIEREHVSLSPRCITWQQMENFTRGGGGINMFCRQHGFKLRIVDVGVDYDFSNAKCRMQNAESGGTQIIDRKIAYGTKNFLHEPAMNEEEWLRALAIGKEQVDECYKEGCNIISFGEMGIANTSPSSILMHLFLDIPLDKCVGAGAGLNADGVLHKLGVLRESVENFKANAPSPVNKTSTGFLDFIFKSKKQEPTTYFEYTLRYFCGFEMAAAIGGMLRAAELGMIILVDGFIMTACMLGASKLDKNVMGYAIFGHCGDESGHRLMLDKMGAQPLLSLGLRLGEGTGAICAYPIVQSAVNMINELDNFQHAEITKYF